MLEIMESMFLRRNFQQTLEVIQRDHPTAADQNKSECCHSGVCCWRRPGAMSLEDAEKIAKFLGTTPQELFETKLVVDDMESLCLLPARKHQTENGKAGTYLDWRETYSLESPCVFLDENNQCSIHEVKPTDCREYRCWDKDTKEGHTPIQESELRSLGWSGERTND